MASYILMVVFLVLSLLPSSPFAATFDFFKLVQRWPESFCNTNNQNCEHPIPEEFTIHGLWPDKYKTQLRQCTNTAYREITDQDLLQRLTKNWPDLLGRRRQMFWEEQWEKHGTCSDMDQKSYFELALSLKNKINLLQILRNNNIYPGTGTISFNQLNNSIVATATTGKNPEIKCNKNKKQLKEIITCFDAAGTSVIDCPLRTGLCSADVLYPSPVSASPASGSQHDEL